MKTFLLVGILLLGAACQCPFCKPADPLYTATPLTATNAFTAGIEGPACDFSGNVFAVNFKTQHTIGRITPTGKSEVFVTLPDKSIGNGIRFDRAGKMYVADYTGHNVLRIDLSRRKIEVFAHEPRMNQPNDLAIAPNGTLFASDPNWKERKADEKQPHTKFKTEVGDGSNEGPINQYDGTAVGYYLPDSSVIRMY